ncbi:HPC2 multi-domain protein [Streptomyces sp. NPDC050263]|uniref:HPC2 multi-domain protein n=1 Tax=Streptomyces sp. NPDC050263 TaxID=3155037 RepID=UPI00342393CB
MPAQEREIENEAERHFARRAETDTAATELAGRPAPRSAALSPSMARGLQSAAGNRAVAGLIAQRRNDQARGPRPAGHASTGGSAATGSTQAGPATAAGPASTVGPVAATGPVDAAGPAVVAEPADMNGPAGADSVNVARSADAAGPVGAAGSAAGVWPTSPAAVVGNARVAGAGAGTAAGVQRLAEGQRDGTKLATLKSDIRNKQKTMSAHKPPATAAQAAQAAAKPPQDDKQAQGKAANAEKMNAAKPGGFDKAAFVKAVNDAIAAQAPKNLDEADNFSGSGKADAVKGQVQGQVADGKKQSAGQIETTTKAPPDTSAAKEKPVTPLQPGQPAATPATPDPANAVPDKAPASATDFSAGPRQVDQQMTDAQVTDEQLAKSNEPEFTGALNDKKAGEQHAATAPAQARGKEAQTLAAAKEHAVQQGGAAMQTMAAANKGATAAVTQGQHGAQGSDEAKRAQVTGILQKVFDATQKDVEQILDGLDKKVDDAFTAGEKKVRDAFTADHERRMDAYKDKRYSGLIGKGRWIKDKFAGLPEEANQIFVVARQSYVAGMQQVISNVADLIGGELTRAKQRIATGRDQLKAEVAKLPADLQAIGKKAAGEFSGKFDELTESVDAKGNELVDTLASKYNDALKSVDAEIEAEKEKNKGLIAKAMDAVGGVIKTILQLKDLLLGILAKAAAAVMAILKDPIGFLSHLVSALGAGLGNFMNNIGAHLQKGLIGWLLGSMSGAGLQLPAKFDLRGILGMIASLLGLTWNAIRGRIVRKGIPEQAMSAVEAGVPLVGKLQNEGVAGVTEEIKEQVGDLKSNLLGKISRYLIPTVLVAGITWIISLLNPASAFVKAVKMIIDIVTFIIDRGAQIVEFVNSVLDAIIAIAGGGAGGVPALIEKALAASIPVLIGALAAILGIGGIADKIKKFFTALSKPVMKAVDWVVARIVKLGKQIWAKLKSKLKGDKGKAGPDPKRPGEGHTLKPDWETVNFSADGHAHRLFVAASGGKATLMVASTEQPVVSFLHRVIADEKTTPEVKQKAQAALQLATTAGGQANEIAKLAVHVPKQGEEAAKQKMTKEQAELSGEQKQLADLLKEIFEQKNSIEPWLGKPVADVPKGLLGYDVRPDSGTFLFGESYSFLQIQRAGGFGSADERSFPMVHVDPAELVRSGAGILRADMEVIKAYRAAIATHRDKLKHDEAPDLEGNPDGLANQLENGANKQRPFNMGIRKQMEAIVNFLHKGGDLTGVEVKVGKKRVDYTARMSIDGRAQHVMIEYKHVTGTLSTERRAELVTKLTAQLTGQIEGGRGKYTTHIIDWPEFSNLDTRSQAEFRDVIEDAKEVGATMGIDVRWSG